MPEAKRRAVRHLVTGGWLSQRGACRLLGLARSVARYQAMPRDDAPLPRPDRPNQHWFLSLAEARNEITRWRMHYNHARPHSSLGYVPPVAYAEQCT